VASPSGSRPSRRTTWVPARALPSRPPPFFFAASRTATTPWRAKPTPFNSVGPRNSSWQPERDSDRRRVAALSAPTSARYDLPSPRLASAVIQSVAMAFWAAVRVTLWLQTAVWKVVSTLSLLLLGPLPLRWPGSGASTHRLR